MRWLLLLIVVGCGAQDPDEARLASMRADVASNAAGKRRFGVVVEPFGAQRPDAVQAWVNTRQEALRACLPDPKLGVVITWDATAITSIRVMSPTGGRSAPGERCLAEEVASSRLSRPVSPGKLYLVASAL